MQPVTHHPSNTICNTVSTLALAVQHVSNEVYKEARAVAIIVACARACSMNSLPYVDIERGHHDARTAQQIKSSHEIKHALHIVFMCMLGPGNLHSHKPFQQHEENFFRAQLHALSLLACWVGASPCWLTQRPSKKLQQVTAHAVSQELCAARNGHS